MFGQFLKTSLIKHNDFDLGIASTYFNEWSDQMWPHDSEYDWTSDGEGIKQSLKWMAQHGVSGYTLIMFSTDDIRMFVLDPGFGTVTVYHGEVVINDEESIEAF